MSGSRRDDNDHVGYPGPRGGDDALDDSMDVPVDLAAVQADDAFLDMLARHDPVPRDTDAGLARVLTAWRRDVDSESIGELVDTDTALATINASRAPVRRKHNALGPVAAAAAVLVIAFSAIGLLAKSAQPGDQLFGLTEVLYSDYARSVKAAAAVKSDLEQARAALAVGDTVQARASLQRAQEQLDVIADGEGRTELAAEHQELKEKLGDLPVDPDDPATVDPSAPPSSSPGPILPLAPSEEPTTTVVPEEPVEPSPSVTPSDPSDPSTTTSTPTTMHSPPSESPRSLPSDGETTGSAPPGSTTPSN